MASIPWWAWLGVGLVVTFVSIWAELDLFIWVGVVFIIVGIAKLAMFFILGRKEDKALADVSQKSVHPEVSARVQQYANPQRIVCPRCMANVSAANFYCGYCGMRVR